MITLLWVSLNTHKSVTLRPFTVTTLPEVSAGPLALPRAQVPELGGPAGQNAADVEEDAGDVATDPADVSLSALLGEHAEVREEGTRGRAVRARGGGRGKDRQSIDSCMFLIAR